MPSSRGCVDPEGTEAHPLRDRGLPTHLEEFVAHSDSSPGRRAFLRHTRDEYALEQEQELSPQGSAQPGRASKAQWPAAASRATKLEGGQPPKTTSTHTCTEVPGLHVGLPFAVPGN